MNKPKFTPGPWEHDGIGVKVFADKMKMNVCDIRGFGHLTSKQCAGLSDAEAIGIQKANAALIAAAPDMYEALGRCLELFNANKVTFEGPRQDVALMYAKMVEGVLKKARG